MLINTQSYINWSFALHDHTCNKSARCLEKVNAIIMLQMKSNSKSCFCVTKREKCHNIINVTLVSQRHVIMFESVWQKNPFTTHRGKRHTHSYNCFMLSLLKFSKYCWAGDLILLINLYFAQTVDLTQTTLYWTFFC